LPCAADEFAEDSSGVRYPPAAVDEIGIGARGRVGARIMIKLQELELFAGAFADEKEVS
jgi:hypothetical protein